MSLPSWIDLPDPGDTAQCAECDGDLTLLRNADGDLIGAECNGCTHAARCARARANIAGCATPAPAHPQSSAEIAHDMAREQHAEDIRDGAYDWCQADPARDDRAGDREARVAG